MPNKQATLDDILRSVNRLIGTANALMERYSRIAEEYDFNRLATEEIREFIKELIVESSRHADGINKRIDRIEEYVILVGMNKGDSQKAGEITQEVSGEHIERTLREQLVEQQTLLVTYQRNLARVKQNIAEMGYETVENSNKVDIYQGKIDKINESISRIRAALK